MSVTWGSIIEPLFKSKLENYFVNQSVLSIDYTDLYVNNVYMYDFILLRVCVTGNM